MFFIWFFVENERKGDKFIFLKDRDLFEGTFNMMMGCTIIYFQIVVVHVLNQKQ
jgi:hypothetical protein